MLANSFIVDPRRTDFTSWANSVRVTNSSIPRPTTEEHWKEWAKAVCATDPNAPNPLSFPDWRTWAIAWLGFQ